MNISVKDMKDKDFIHAIEVMALSFKKLEIPYVIFEFDENFEFIEQIIGLDNQEVNEDFILGKHVVINEIYYENAPLAKNLFAKHNLEKKELKIIDTILSLSADYIDEFDVAVPISIYGKILISPHYFIVKTNEFVKKIKF